MTSTIKTDAELRESLTSIASQSGITVDSDLLNNCFVEGDKCFVQHAYYNTGARYDLDATDENCESNLWAVIAWIQEEAQNSNS